MAGYCSISARRNVIKMTLESVDDTIFSLSDILYTTLRASDEVYEVRALAGDVDLAGIVRGGRIEWQRKVPLMFRRGRYLHVGV